MDAVESQLRDGDGRRLVRISRHCSSDQLDGYIVAVGQEWLLVAVLADAIEVDGYAALRVRDVSEIADRAEPAAFVQRALEQQGTWPPRSPEPPMGLDDAEGLLRSVMAAYEVLIVYTEDEDEDVCFVGVPLSVDDGELGLHELRFTAEWEESATMWELDEISRVDFGDRYSTRLHAVAAETGMPQA